MTNSRELIKKIISGDTHAFKSLIHDYQRLVCHVIFKMVTNEQDREDVCQDVFIKVYQNLSKFQFDSKLSTWIAKIAFNTGINYLKKQKVPLFDDVSGENGAVEKYWSEETSPDGFTHERDLTCRLQHEITKLPVQFKTILTLYHLEEMSYTEISEITGLPDGTVKSYLFRARKLLKEKLIAKYQQEELWH